MQYNLFLIKSEINFKFLSEDNPNILNDQNNMALGRTSTNALVCNCGISISLCPACDDI